MSLEKVPMKLGGGAKKNASLKQGCTATQRGATTSRHRYTENLRRESYHLYTLQDQQRGREMEGENCCTKARFRAQKNWMTYQSE